MKITDKIETYEVIFTTVSSIPEAYAILHNMRKKRAIKTKGNCELR